MWVTPENSKPLILRQDLNFRHDGRWAPNRYAHLILHHLKKFGRDIFHRPLQMNYESIKTLLNYYTENVKMEPTKGMMKCLEYTWTVFHLLSLATNFHCGVCDSCLARDYC